MLNNDLLATGLYVGFFAATGLPAILLKVFFNVPFELIRKIYHLVFALSIFPLVTFFSQWYMAVLAVFLFTLIVYPILVWVEQAAFYRRIAAERARGEFKSSLVIAQMSMALTILIFWGLLGDAWKYIVVVAVMGWGLGDAAAALVGKTYGRRRVRHPRISGAKTVEGTLAMFLTAGLAMFAVLVIYAGRPLQESIAVALLVAPVCAAVELFTSRGLDTITVPVSTGLAVLSWSLLFSFLGL